MSAFGSNIICICLDDSKDPTKLGLLVHAWSVAYAWPVGGGTKKSPLAGAVLNRWIGEIEAV